MSELSVTSRADANGRCACCGQYVIWAQVIGWKIVPLDPFLEGDVIIEAFGDNRLPLVRHLLSDEQPAVPTYDKHACPEQFGWKRPESWT